MFHVLYSGSQMHVVMWILELKLSPMYTGEGGRRKEKHGKRKRKSNRNVSVWTGTIFFSF